MDPISSPSPNPWAHRKPSRAKLALKMGIVGIFALLAAACSISAVYLFWSWCMGLIPYDGGLLLLGGWFTVVMAGLAAALVGFIMIVLLGLNTPDIP